MRAAPCLDGRDALGDAPGTLRPHFPTTPSDSS
jgi:hypothetical protein